MTNQPPNSFPDIARRNLTMQYVELPIVLRLFGVPRSARILDLGCGRGFCMAALQQSGYTDVTGVDIDVAALMHAAVRDSLVMCGDACLLPVRSESVDVVFDFGTSYHVIDSALALIEIERVLRPGGMHIHETRASQLLSHPVRARGRVLPWSAAPGLQPGRHAGLWASRIKR